MIDGLKKLEKREVPEIGPREYRTAGTAFYDAIYHATNVKLAHTDQGRRALIIFSDGEDNSSAHNMMDTIEAAQTENVVLFGIRYTETRKGGEWTARNKYGASVMARMSHDTGGSDFDAQAADLRTSFREIGEQLRSSYELAYHAGVADGTFHKLVIRVKTPGFTVRTQDRVFSRDGSRSSTGFTPASPPPEP